MMLVVWTRPAIADLDEIQDYVARRSPKAAYRIVNDIINRSEALLSRNAMIGRSGRVARTRELVLPRTPYIVVYRPKTRIEIIAVVHGAQDWPDEFT